MRFTLRCVQCMATSVLRDQQYTKFARCRESIVDKEQPGRHVVATSNATIAKVDAFVLDTIVNLLLMLSRPMCMDKNTFIMSYK